MAACFSSKQGGADRRHESRGPKVSGRVWNFSQPIEDNVGETLTGTKGQLALKVFGSELNTLEAEGRRSQAAVMAKIPGLNDVKLLRDFGQPNLNLTLIGAKPHALGSTSPTYRTRYRRPLAATPVSQVLIDEQRYDVVVRYQAPYRSTAQAIEQDSPAFPVGRAGVSGPVEQKWRSKTAPTISIAKGIAATWP